MTSANLDNSSDTYAPLSPDAVLQDRYRIVRRLGKGGMGAVYEALDQRLAKTVALKETLSSEPSMRKQFEREARLLAGMQHPALPQVTDHFVEGDRAFLVMQFIGGVDLAKIISQQPGPFPRDQVIAWADQLLDALIYLHTRDRQVIHRDIKPHNLKLTSTGQIALLDFGLAKSQVSDPSVTASQSFFGFTRHYSPLEQIQDQRTDPRSDIYALGATLYHLLTGIKPPDAMVRASAVLHGDADPLLSADSINTAVGTAVAAILNKAMSQKPGDRYATATEFREALRRIGRSETAVKRPWADAEEVVAGGIAPTVHVSKLASASEAESAMPNIALVGSARRFGPAGATALLAILAAVAGGLFYGSQWLSPKVKAGSSGLTTSAASALRQNAAAERTRSTDGSAVKSKAQVETKNNRGSEKRTEAKENVQSSRKEVVNRPNSGDRGDAGASRKNSQRVTAPAIRLPHPDFRDHSPSPSPDSRTRSYGSTSAAPNLAAPKFYLAADGTRIVKFFDGSTQYVRPGERTAQNSASYR